MALFQRGLFWRNSLTETNLEVVGLKHAGKLRKYNQDNFLALARLPELGGSRALLVVADGLGGHSDGARASEIVVETLEETFQSYLHRSEAEDTQPLKRDDKAIKRDSLLAMQEQLRLAIKTANENILEFEKESTKEGEPHPASTLVAAIINGNQVVIAHVGDSRAYLLRKSTLKQLTQDHSYVGELIRAKELPESAIYDHPKRNVVLRALGQEAVAEVDFQHFELLKGDQLMLCSDGLWGMIQESNEMKHILAGNPPKTAAKKLISLANKLGGEDNISVVIARIDSLNQERRE